MITLVHSPLNLISPYFPVSHKILDPENMAVSQVDWSQFLGEDSELPPDVVFNVKEQGEEEEDEILNLEDWKTSQVPAHKLLLAGVSLVFRREFFGALKTTKDIIDIKETTIEAFTVMINFICKPDGLKNVNCPQTLCEILNLAERYQVIGLKDAVTQKLEKLTINPENMMFTAIVAKNYAVFLKTKFQTPAQVFDFLHCSHSSFPEADTEILIELLRANGTCPHCKMNSNECFDGKDITNDYLSKMVEGMKIAWKTWVPGGKCGFSCSDSDVPSSGLAQWTRGNSVRGGFGYHQPQHSSSTLSLECIGHDKAIVVCITLNKIGINKCIYFRRPLTLLTL